MIRVGNPENPKDKTPVIVAGKDVGEVDNDFFLCPVNILDHQGTLKCGFPVENRIVAQRKQDLKNILRTDRNRNYHEKLADFHLLLYLGNKLDRSDLSKICQCIRENKPILDGYRFMIESLPDI